MDYFTDLLATFLDLDRVNHIAVYGMVRELSECIKKYEQSFYGFGTTWGWVINDKIFILGWSNLLN